MALVTAGVVVLDCAEPEKLAEFSKEFLDAQEKDTTVDHVELTAPGGMRLALRRDANATPPSWPRPENSLQIHLDFLVEDLDAAERRVVALGGLPVGAKGAPGPHEERSFADPAGHSFTLRRTPQAAPKRG
ncbi:VOC family protein [Streptomyces actuosus]|uniref:VOC family protein n=1 Tax=Streptomyces actuosus TaxID=1885 RepID=A0ABS2VHW6_STRAS|nr:VOC family protein [Streptomyces actuosus]MBN0042674.1 VOC family protein [Streptomyces actuosus]